MLQDVCWQALLPCVMGNQRGDVFFPCNTSPLDPFGGQVFLGFTLENGCNDDADRLSPIESSRGATYFTLTNAPTKPLMRPSNEVVGGQF